MTLMEGIFVEADIKDSQWRYKPRYQWPCQDLLYEQSLGFGKWLPFRLGVATVPLGVVLKLQIVGKFLLQTPIAHSDLPDFVGDFLI